MDWNAAKLRTEAIVPWITVLALSVGGAYTLFEYSGKQRDARVQTTFQYVTRYASPPLSDSRTQLERAWIKRDPTSLPVLRQANLQPGIRARAYATAVLSMIDEEEASTAVEETLRFFEELAQCIKLRLCDADSADSLLVGNAREFFHQYYPYVCRLRTRWNDDTAGIELQRLVSPKSTTGDLCKDVVEPSRAD